jgi:RNA polymerase sigma-70 factor (ECF subfamily)
MTRKEIVLRLLERLIRERHVDIVRFATYLTKDPASAEDIVQEAYCRVLTRWHLYDRRGDFAAWCRVIIRNIHIDRLRKRPMIMSLDQLVVCNGDGMLPLGHLLPARDIPIYSLLERQEEEKAAHNAYSRLSPRNKEVVGLVVAEGLKYKQVAQKLGLPINTVRSRLHRARKAARAMCGGEQC